MSPPFLIGPKFLIEVKIFLFPDGFEVDFWKVLDIYFLSYVVFLIYVIINFVSLAKKVAIIWFNSNQGRTQVEG